MMIGNSFNTQNTNYIDQNKTGAEQALSKIAAVRELSGKDSSNLMIADSLSLQISTLTQGIQNSNDAVGMLQVADAALSNVSKSTEKLNELSVRYNSAALNSDQKGMLAQEFNATRDAMQDMIDSTTYNSKALFNESMTFETGAGEINVTSLEVEGIEKLSIENQEGISSFMDTLSSVSSNIGSSMQQFEVSITNSLSAVSNLTSSYSQISEKPMDEKVNDFKQNEIKLQSSILSQVHQSDMLQKKSFSSISLIDNNTFYKKAYDKHGATPRGLNWNSKKTQELRFQIITELLSEDISTCSIVDAGCGFGDLYRYWEEKGIKAKNYIGIDSVKKSIKIARQRVSKAIFINKDILKDELPDADWYVASGSLNILSNFQTWLFLENMLLHSNKGIIFNILKGQRKSDTFNYKTKEEIENFVQEKKLTCKIVENYLEDDISVKILKEKI